MSARYQRGSVCLDKRTGVWFYRWRENGVRRAARIGPLSDYPTKGRAIRASEHLQIAANCETPTQDEVTVRAIAERYRADHIPERFSTRRAYTSYLDGHILPRWGEVPIKNLRPLPVEEWLKNLKLAGRTKSHIKGVLRRLVKLAMKLELLPFEVNPLDLVEIRGGTKRQAEPKILTVEEFHLLLAQIDEEPFRTMLLVDLALGLRCSELLALKWSDVDWDKLTLLVERAIVGGRVDQVKTRCSRVRVPLDPAVAELLLQWKRQTAYAAESDWVWASPFEEGRKPYYSWGVQQRRIKPAGLRAGLGPIGWHTLRHTYRALLDDTGAPMTVQQELMRHASITTTMNVYGGAMPKSKREAHSKVVRMVLPA